MITSTTTPVAAALDLTLEKARRLRRNKTPLALLMLSGGLDSVVLLAALLEHTEFDIHAHHVELDNAERRLGAERRALEQVYLYCEEHYRPFEHSSSGHEFRVRGRSGGTDTELTMFTAGRVCHALAGRVDLVVTGHINPGFGELAHGEAVFHACFFNAPFRPQWIRPLARVPGSHASRKRSIWDSVPTELAERSWWCRRPIVAGDGWQRCEKCHACEIMVKALADEPSSGPT